MRPVHLLVAEAATAADPPDAGGGAVDSSQAGHGHDFYPARMARTLLRGGEVLIGDPGRGELAGADLLIEDGRIAAIGPGIEAEADVIDAAGG